MTDVLLPGGRIRFWVAGERVTMLPDGNTCVVDYYDCKGNSRTSFDNKAEWIARLRAAADALEAAP